VNVCASGAGAAFSSGAAAMAAITGIVVGIVGASPAGLTVWFPGEHSGMLMALILMVGGGGAHSGIGLDPSPDGGGAHSGIGLDPSPE